MNQVSDISDSLMKTINKYKHHPSILPIYSKLSRPESFSFNATFEKKKNLLICVGTVKVLVHNKPIFFD